jgi:hypothetical protein
MEDKAKRNEVYIKTVVAFQHDIVAIGDSVKKDCDWSRVAVEIRLVRENIARHFSNREMALAVTKLQEAGFWVNSKNVTQTKNRLVEASNWAGAYIETLE